MTRMPCAASSMARLLASVCRPPMSREYADDGSAAIAWCAHMEPMLTMAPPPAVIMPRATVCVMKKADLASSR